MAGESERDIELTSLDAYWIAVQIEEEPRSKWAERVEKANSRVKTHEFKIEGERVRVQRR